MGQCEPSKPESTSKSATSTMTQRELDLLGISVSGLRTHFLKEVEVTPGLNANSTVNEIEDLQKDTQGVIRRESAGTICPISKRSGASYVHTRLKTDPSIIGHATVMLSYAWHYKIGDIIDVLEYHCSVNNLNPQKTFVWICCLCVNQHEVVESMRCGRNISFERFQKIFHDRVTSIGHIIALMAPWDRAIYLTRACTNQERRGVKMEIKWRRGQ